LGTLFAHDFGNCLAPARGFLFGRTQLAQSLEASMDGIRLVGAAERFGEDVTHTSRFHNGTHSPTSDNTGTRGSRFEHDLRGTKARRDHKRNGCAGERYLYEVLLGIFDAFTDGLGIFTGLTETGTDMAIAITYDNECPDAEASATLNNLCYTAHLYDRFLEV